MGDHRDGMPQCPRSGDVLRCLADTVDGPMPRRSFARVMRMLRIVAANAEPDVFRDGEIDNESALLGAMLDSKRGAAHQLEQHAADLRKRGRLRALRCVVVGAVCTMNSLLLVWVLSQVWQARTPLGAIGWAWCVIGNLYIYGLAAAYGLNGTAPQDTQP